MSPAEVTCPAGTVVGVEDGGVRRFHSIPYARIVGGFDDPLPAEQGSLIDATQPLPGTPALSITTPAGAHALTDLPVVVWIHGGRFETGDHTETYSDPDGFARDGVVHVRLGYRLKFPGLLPFHTDPPGHYRAVADCAEALRWIQRNIEAFGGDPTNVTLAGQSAGAAVVLWLTRRDHYRGEFRRALAMSPAFPRRGFEDRKWATRGALGQPLTRGALNALFARDRAKVERAYRRFRTQYITDMALGPHPLDPAEMAQVPLVLTCTDDEFYGAGAPYDRSGMGPAVARGFGPRMDLAREAASDYLAHAKRADPGHVAGRLMSDSLCRRFVDRVAEGAPGPVWLAEHAGHTRHSADLDALFHGELRKWFLQFARTGEAGWEAYGADRVAMRRTLRGSQVVAEETVTDPLGYLRGAFREV